MSEHNLWPLRWRGPLDESAFRLVKGTPFNCLVVDPAPAVAAFQERTRREGLELRTLGGDDPAVLIVTECEWPRVRVTDSKDSAEAGPTGVPWVDSNGWKIQMLRARAPEKVVWLSVDPPKDAQFFQPSAYTLAVADAAGYGAKWIASVPPGDKAAWEATVAATRFFERHSQWRSYRPVARLGVLSDFTGDNEFASSEMLNLTARRQQPFRVLDKTKSIDLTGLVAVIYTDKEALSGELLAQLASFVQNGGLLILQPGAAKALGGTPSAEAHPRFRFLTSGKGRIAVAKEDWADPYTTAADAHLMMSHRNDMIRLYNHGSCGSYISSSPDGKGDLVQLLRYAARPAESLMTVTVAGKYSSATFYSLDREQPQSIKPIPVKAGVDVPLPEFTAYAAIELGR